MSEMDSLLAMRLKELVLAWSRNADAAAARDSDDRWRPTASHDYVRSSIYGDVSDQLRAVMRDFGEIVNITDDCACEWDAVPPNIACPVHREH